MRENEGENLISSDVFEYLNELGDIIAKHTTSVYRLYLLIKFCRPLFNVYHIRILSQFEYNVKAEGTLGTSFDEIYATSKLIRIVATTYPL